MKRAAARRTNKHPACPTDRHPGRVGKSDAAIRRHLPLPTRLDAAKMINVESKPVTLRDVATEAGCSHSTVSLALRNHPRIPERTRTRVQGIAERMGYRSNPYVQSLLSQVRRGRVQPQRAGLALISNYQKPKQWRNMPNNRVAVEGAFQRARELGFSLEEFRLTEKGMNFTRLEKILKARGIRGILVAPTPDDRLRLDMDIRSFAVVSMGQSLLNPSLSTVSHYHSHSMRQTLEELKERDYCRIGCSIDRGNDARIEAGWSAHFQHFQNLSPGTRRIPIHLRSQEASIDELVEYTRVHRLDALVTDRHDYLEKLTATGICAPKDLGFACLALPTSQSRISGIYQNNQRTGSLSVELLVQLINNSNFGVPAIPQHVFTPGEWQEGTSLRAKQIRHKRNAPLKRGEKQ